MYSVPVCSLHCTVAQVKPTTCTFTCSWCGPNTIFLQPSFQQYIPIPLKTNFIASQLSELCCCTAVGCECVNLLRIQTMEKSLWRNNIGHYVSEASTHLPYLPAVLSLSPHTTPTPNTHKACFHHLEIAK